MFTGRFAAPNTPLGRVFASLPASVSGGLPVQVASTPAYPHAHNVGRVPRFTDHTIPLGEHPGVGTTIPLGELAVTADWGRLYLVWKNRVVEPAAFHALALEKQPPVMAQFLVNVARGSLTPFLELDWGPARELPYLPQVPRGRSLLATSRWRLTLADLPAQDAPAGRPSGACARGDVRCGLLDDSRNLTRRTVTLCSIKGTVGSSGELSMAYHGIETGRPYYLIHAGAGIEAEISNRWEWLRLPEERGSHGKAVIFHQQGDGYVIEQTKPYWDNYMFWQAAQGGICLNQVNESSQWFANPGENGGFTLSTEDGLYVRSCSGIRQWFTIGDGHDDPRYGRAEGKNIEFTLVSA